MERPFRLDRFASDARANLQRGRMTSATVDSVVYFVRRGTVETRRLYRVVRTANVFAPERFDRSTEAWVWDAAFFVGLCHSGDSRIVEIDPTEAATLETRLRERTARERARGGTGVWADY